MSRKKHAMNIEDRVKVRPGIILGNFPLKAGEIDDLGKSGDLGPWSLDPENALLEVNGAVIARGTVSMDENGALFTIVEMNQETDSPKTEEQ